MTPEKRTKRQAELIRLNAWFERRLAQWHGPASRQELYIGLMLVFTINILITR